MPTRPRASTARPTGSRRTRSTRSPRGRSFGPPLRRLVRLLVPILEGRLLPGRLQAGRVPTLLRKPSPDRRAQFDLLPPAARGAVRALGRADRARVPIRRHPRSPGDVFRANRGRGRGSAGDREARRPARPGPDQGATSERRRVPPPSARLARPCNALGARLPARVVVRSRPADPARRARSRLCRRGGGRCRLSLSQAENPPYVEDDLAAEAARIQPLLDAGLDVYAYFRHEDEPTGPRYAERLLGSSSAVWRRMTKRRACQVSSIEQLLLSTSPASRPTPCTVSKVRSVLRPEAFFWAKRPRGRPPAQAAGRAAQRTRELAPPGREENRHVLLASQPRLDPELLRTSQERREAPPACPP